MSIYLNHSAETKPRHDQRIEMKMSLKMRKAPGPIAINLMQENVLEQKTAKKSDVPFKYVAKAAFDALQEAVCLTDMNLNVIYCNKKMAQIFRRNQRLVSGEALFSMLPEEFHFQFHSTIEFVRKTGGCFSGKLSSEEKNSSKHTYKYEISIRETGKTAPFLMISIFNLSESHPSIPTKEEAGQTQNIGDLVLSISQELSLPLNQVSKHVDRIIELLGNFQNSKLDHHLNGIINQVYRISSLAHNLTALSKHSAPTYVNLNVNEIILDAIENCEQDWSKRVALNLHLDEALPSIMGDPFLLTSAFQNLIRVADELAGDDAVPRLKTGLSRSRKYVSAVFETRGPITSPEELHTLLESFQGNGKLSPGGRLGLYISKKMLEVQQCKLSITSNKKSGNMIEVCLPVFSFIGQLKKKRS